MGVILRSYVFFLGKYLVVIENNRNFAPDIDDYCHIVILVTDNLYVKANE